MLPKELTIHIIHGRRRFIPDLCSSRQIYEVAVGKQRCIKHSSTQRTVSRPELTKYHSTFLSFNNHAVSTRKNNNSRDTIIENVILNILYILAYYRDVPTLANGVIC